MLANSFSFLPRVGEKTERRLWTRGVRTWSDYRAAGTRVKGVAPGLKRQHEDVLAVAEGALRSDPAFFAKLLPPAEHWRALGEFGSGAVYLDIETTGGLGGRNDVTVVGVKRGSAPTRTLVRGDDLTPEAVTAACADARVLVTFNGASFDLPMLRAMRVALPDVPHVDLRYPLTRLGFTGGLKKIERQAGLARDDDLEGLSGYDAVLLWHRHELGDEEALPLLLAYNRADVDNLLPLADLAYAGLRRDTFEAACRAGRNGALALAASPLASPPASPQ